jgi:hypothetical protein
MHKGFQVGKLYIYMGPKEVRPHWNQKMEFALDGLPHFCVEGFGSDAIMIDDGQMWSWSDGFEYWKEYIPEESSDEPSTIILPKKPRKKIALSGKEVLYETK